MSIRYWKSDDLTLIMCLINELSESLGEESTISIDLIKKQYNEMNKYPDIYQNYVYVNESEIVGFISLMHYRSLLHKKGTTQINELVVKKEYRKEGIGTKLLQFAIRNARESMMDEIEVGVMKENTNAIQFYKNNGLSEEYYLLGMEIRNE